MTGSNLFENPQHYQKLRTFEVFSRPFLLIELTNKSDTPTIIQIPSDHQILLSILSKCNLKVYTQNLLDPFTNLPYINLNVTYLR